MAGPRTQRVPTRCGDKAERMPPSLGRTKTHTNIKHANVLCRRPRRFGRRAVHPAQFDRTETLPCVKARKGSKRDAYNLHNNGPEVASHAYTGDWRELRSQFWPESWLRPRGVARHSMCRSQGSSGAGRISGHQELRPKMTAQGPELHDVPCFRPRVWWASCLSLSFLTAKIATNPYMCAGAERARRNPG